MAHELEERNGVIEAAFAGQKPWHGLGQMVKEHMTTDEALDLAHLRWRIMLLDLQYTLPDNAVPDALYEGDYTRTIPDTRAIIREDTGEYFGTVGNRYTPIQNEDQAAFIQALIGDGNVVECCGALFGGRKVFWTVKCPTELLIGGEDRIEKYLIIVNGHDGSIGFTVFWSPIRVVCNNTLRAALDGKGEQIVRLKHTNNVHDRVDDARKTLGIAEDYFNQVGEKFESFLTCKINPGDFLAYTEKLFGDKEDTRNIVKTNYQAENQQGTMWGAYNAVTQFADHQMRFRGTVGREEKRFESVLYGPGFKVKKRAFELANSYVGN